jgi:hypothetical protein
MTNLSIKIKIYLDREVDFDKDVILQDDMVDGVSNPYIKEWNVEEAQPTEAQLNALESQADELKTANQVISNRKAEYPSIEECVHAILDDDLENLQILRQAVKEKFPKNE